MDSPQSMGMNRTGIDMAPQGAKQMLNATREFPTNVIDNEQAISDLRSRYLRDADPIGTVPPPGTVKGVAKAGMQKMMGRHAEVLIDCLSARLAFERTGTRLYDALIGKCLTRKDEATMVSTEQLMQFRAEEAAHIGMCWDALRQLGADPTCVTPMADVNAIASNGLYQIVTDPRTTTGQSLHAIHIAELADNDGWWLLVELAQQMGQDEMVERFRTAWEEEDDHLEALRQWRKQIELSQAGIS